MDSLDTSDLVHSRRGSSVPAANMYGSARKTTLSSSLRFDPFSTPQPKRRESNSGTNELQTQLRAMLETCKQQSVVIHRKSESERQLQSELDYLDENLTISKRQAMHFRFKQFYACVLMAHYRAVCQNQKELIHHLSELQSAKSTSTQSQQHEHHEFMTLKAQNKSLTEQLQKHQNQHIQQNERDYNQNHGVNSQEISKLKAENERLRSQNESLQRSIENMDEQSALSVDQQSVQIEDFQKLKELNRALNAEIRELRGKVNTMEIHQTSLEAIKELRDESQKHHLESIDNLKHRVKDLTKKNARLEMEKEEWMNRDEAVLTDELKAIEDDLTIKRLKESVSTSKSNNKQLQTEITRLKAKMKNMAQRREERVMQSVQFTQTEEQGMFLSLSPPTPTPKTERNEEQNKKSKSRRKDKDDSKEKSRSHRKRKRHERREDENTEVVDSEKKSRRKERKSSRKAKRKRVDKKPSIKHAESYDQYFRQDSMRKRKKGRKHQEKNKSADPSMVPSDDEDVQVKQSVDELQKRKLSRAQSREQTQEMTKMEAALAKLEALKALKAGKITAKAMAEKAKLKLQQNLSARTSQSQSRSRSLQPSAGDSGSDDGTTASKRVKSRSMDDEDGHRSKSKRESIHYPKLGDLQSADPESTDEANKELRDENQKLQGERELLIKQNETLRGEKEALVRKTNQMSSEQFCYVNEVESLNFQIAELEKNIKHLEFEKRQLTAQKKPKLLDMMNELLANTLLEGIFVRKYNRRGRFSFKRVIVHFEKGFIDFESGALQLKYLQKVLQGINTDVFHKAHKKNTLLDNVDTCLSLVFPSRTLDLQTSGRLQAKCLFDAFINFMNQRESAERVELERVESFGISDFVSNKSEASTRPNPLFVDTK